MMRTTRAAMLEVIGLNYARTARGKGLSKRVVTWKHLFLGALVPVTTMSGIQLGYLLGGTVIVEQIFVLPGLGRLLITSINERDFPVVQTVTLIFAAGFIIVNMLTDVLYTVIDPRTAHVVTLAGPLPVPAPAGAPVESGAPAGRGDPADAPGRRTLMASLWHNSNGRTGCVLVGLVLLAAIAGALGITPYPAQSQDPSAVLKSPSFSHLLGTGPVRARPFLAGPAGPVHIGQDRLRGRGHRRGHRDRGRDRGGLPRALDGERHHAGHGHAFRHPGHPLRPGHRDGTGPGLAEQRPGHRHRLHTHLRPGGTGAGPRTAGSRLRAGGPGARVLRRRLLFRHILPNVAGTVAVQTSLALAWSVLAEASLSFLGLGPPPPTASLGEMVSQSSSLAGTAWWTLAAPSVAIVIAVIGFNFLGDGLRDAIDPRARAR